jgi:hypothetical protein
MGLMKLLGTSFSTILNGGNPTADRTITFPDASGEALLKGTSLTLMTAQNSTSGTSIDFTGIPSWAKRITVMFNEVSTSGSSNPIIQIGSTTVSTTGYKSVGSNITNAASPTGASATTGLLLAGATSSTSVFSGIASISIISGNLWVFESLLGRSDAATTMTGGGISPTLGGALDRIRITTVNGTDTFDAGSINVLYEG